MLFILHTYLIYPALMIWGLGKRRVQREEYSSRDSLPTVSVLIAAYNEGAVIRQKILSLFNTSYPLEKINVYVGSDASTDNTEDEVLLLKYEFSNLYLIRFENRTGKIGIVNELQSLTEDEILIMSDANVMFTRETISELIKPFKDKNTGIVAGNIIKHSASNLGIARQEKFYLSVENKIKLAESNAFNLVMGAEGGCYAIRNNLFNKVPSKFNVDDFYITLQVILKKKKVLFAPGARCTEDVPGNTRGEYRRKVRISSGNFQNLFFFRKIFFSPWTPAGFCFISHKVLRWFTPLFLLSAFLCSAVLMRHSVFFIWAFALQALGFATAVIPLKSSYFRFVSHFYLMNAALLHGLIIYLRGIKTSIWEPTDREV